MHEPLTGSPDGTNCTLSLTSTTLRFKDAKQEAAKVVVGTIRELQASGIDHSVEIVEAITDARAGEERHYRDCDESVCRKKRCR
jgi:hypothetical protein